MWPCLTGYPFFMYCMQVLYASLPSMQQRLRELQPVALTALCQLLQSLAGSLPAAVQAGEQGTATLALASRALRVLRQALANAATALEKQELSSSSIIHLLFNIALTAAAPRPGSSGEVPAEGAAFEAAAAALDCAADLQTLYLGTEQTQQMLEALVPRLQASKQSTLQDSGQGLRSGQH